MTDRSRRFTATVVSAPKRRVFVPLPFAPDDAWGPKPAHPVAGSVNGMGVRAVVEVVGEGWGIVLGPAWRRDCGVAPGDEVDVVLYPPATGKAGSRLEPVLLGTGPNLVLPDAE